MDSRWSGILIPATISRNCQESITTTGTAKNFTVLVGCEYGDAIEIQHAVIGVSRLNEFNFVVGLDVQECEATGAARGDKMAGRVCDNAVCASFGACHKNHIAMICPTFEDGDFVTCADSEQ